MLIAFDLDMTLVDSRAAIGGALDLLSDETGVAVDSAAIVTRLGPPIVHELLVCFGPERVDEALAIFRRHLRETTMPLNVALPGAAAAVESVVEAGGEVAVVTGKHAPLAELTLATVGISAAHVVGDVWAEQKAPVLQRLGAVAYVGDHERDMVAARQAGVTAIGVTTGPPGRSALLAAGADVVLDDLTEWSVELVDGGPRGLGHPR